MSLEGLAGVQAKLAEHVAKMQAEAEAAADESALLLEAVGKSTKAFKDRTGFLRGSIRGTYKVTPEGVRVVLSANKVYAASVEFGHFAKRGTTRYSTRKGKATSMRVSDRAYGTAVQGRPFIWPTVVDQQKNVISIFRRRLSV